MVEKAKIYHYHEVPDISFPVGYAGPDLLNPTHEIHQIRWELTREQSRQILRDFASHKESPQSVRVFTPAGCSLDLPLYAVDIDCEEPVSRKSPDSAFLILSVGVSRDHQLALTPDQDLTPFSW